jgi:hypothetical protein
LNYIEVGRSCQIEQPLSLKSPPPPHSNTSSVPLQHLHLQHLHSVCRELGVDPFVENEHDRVVLLDGAAEERLEQAVRAHGLGDVSAQPPLRHQLGRLEPAHVLREAPQRIKSKAKGKELILQKHIAINDITDIK